MERSTITDILEYRYILETGCLRRCFGTITPRHILRLTELDETCCDLRVERSTITDILEYRYILETGCLRRCFGTITPRHILRLTELDETCCDPEKAGDLWSHWEHNAAFHLELIRLAGNRYATQQLTQALETLKRAYVQYYWDKRQQVLTAEDMRHHRLLLEALRAQDLESACHILAQDIQSFAY